MSPDDGLSYCTWNGIGQHLSEQKLFDALESLAKNEINISNLIIDDNWQSRVRYSFTQAKKMILMQIRTTKEVTNSKMRGSSSRPLRLASHAVSKPQ
jgi:hypothetical protein